MTKSVLIEKIAEKVEGLSKKQTEVVIETIFDSVKDALAKGGKVEIRGFGNFKLRSRNARKARNPKTGEGVDVPPKKVPYFKVGKELREMVNKNL
ncbi:MAG: integration host factor subunit beta [Nitrospira bacterium SG8_35_1]|jgi:integration host factor subunit beta|nr:MAG: integration host factor subunit beta [Nitrospira bacterium SG8_35_1]UCE71653.1 MAG: integration host factor subunit beta [Nitrospiraceae bacterium]